MKLFETKLTLNRVLHPWASLGFPRRKVFGKSSEILCHCRSPLPGLKTKTRIEISVFQLFIVQSASLVLIVRIKLLGLLILSRRKNFGYMVYIIWYDALFKMCMPFHQ